MGHGRRDSSVYIGLLRGINVGGKNILPMAKLAAMFAESGCAEVQTYIQSGNVIFSAEPFCAARIPELIPEMIGKAFGFLPKVILRSAVELKALIGANPFLKRGESIETLHVGWMAEEPNAADIAALDRNRSPGDVFKMRGREIYLNLPNGMGKTKLTNAYFDSKLKTTCTFRNWRTMLKLLELSGED